MSGSGKPADPAGEFPAEGSAPLGKVWFVGSGPGAADLLTLRAANILAQADAILHDALVMPEVLDFAPHAKRISVGKRYASVSTEQAAIDRLLVSTARENRTVVRLKGGDPTLFGRLDEEIAALEAADIEWEVVPGVTAATAAAAVLGRSLTRRGRARRVVIATPRTGRGEKPNHDWSGSIDPNDTAILYMASHVAADSARALIANGFAPHTAAAIVHAATRGDQSILRTTLGELAQGTVREHAAEDRPALLIVGAPAEPS
jgi:uroporphyrin-III C-methyltransferase